MSELGARLRDEIDDQVAEAFDAYLAERLAARGPLRRRAILAVMALVLGAAVTVLAPVGVAVGCGMWLAIAVTNVLLLAKGS